MAFLAHLNAEISTLSAIAEVHVTNHRTLRRI